MSALGRVMEHFPQAVIYCTLRGKQGMERFFDISKWNIKTVKTGDSLNIGKHTLMFLETPMLHWPDSMMTYVKEAKVLFSQDAFGQHIATTQRFDDEYIESSSINELEAITIDYYANILMPFGRLIKSKIAEIVKLNMEIDIIAPDHGLIWRKSPEMAIDIYLKMADGHAKLRVALIYDTMWHSTEQMTLPLIQGIREEGVECKVIKLRATPMSAAITEFWNSRGCLVGSPTLNNEVFPSVAEFIVHLRGLRPKDRMVGAFGSYGWGGGAVKWLYNEFDVMKLKSVPEGVQVNYRASDEDEIRCFEFGREFARNVKEYHRQFK
jgi:flavorubredoxin